MGKTWTLSLFALHGDSNTLPSLFANSPARFSGYSAVELFNSHIVPTPYIATGNTGIQLTTSLAYLDDLSVQHSAPIDFHSQHHF